MSGGQADRGKGNGSWDALDINEFHWGGAGSANLAFGLVT